VTEALLQKPILALTLSFAGKREVAADALAGLHADLGLVFREVANGLGAYHDEARAGGPAARRFTADAPARLTLVTGLADGSDHIAADLFNSPNLQSPHVARRLGAILPCPRDDYVANSRIEDTATFERQAAACAFILELDGQMPRRPDADQGDEAARTRAIRQRGAAFNAQSEFLLRHGDLLVAVDDPSVGGQIGGTRQSIRNALDFGLPVVLLRLGRPGIAILRTRSDMDDPPALQGDAALEGLTALVVDLIGSTGQELSGPYVAELLEEFYSGTTFVRGPFGGATLLPRIWSWFEKCFRRTTAIPPSLQAAAPYLAFRQRAAELSAYYAGLYRGSFLLGYLLALMAVGLAVASLLIVVYEARCPAHSATAICAGLEHHASWLLPILLVSKGVALIGMAWLSQRAHGKHLSHRAADYRYLAERLRAMIFLPHAGSLRPPSHLSQPFTTRVATQSVIDRLFRSIVRQADPLVALPTSDGKTIRPDSSAAREVVRNAWLAAQQTYHANNADTLNRMTRWLDVSGRVIGFLAIGLVFLDGVTALLGSLVHGVKEAKYVVEPWVIALDALLPAAIASLNGVRFQSECSRLADRSEQMKYELQHLEQRAETVWARSAGMLDVLRVAEDAARLTLDEVAEWTAIYGKEFVEM